MRPLIRVIWSLASVTGLPSPLALRALVMCSFFHCLHRVDRRRVHLPSSLPVFPDRGVSELGTR
jgi:hypothetical protein